MLYQVTEPVLEPIRKLVPPLGGVMDISILIAFFAISDSGAVIAQCGSDPCVGKTKRPPGEHPGGLFSCATTLLDISEG